MSPPLVSRFLLIGPRTNLAGPFFHPPLFHGVVLGPDPVPRTRVLLGRGSLLVKGKGQK